MMVVVNAAFTDMVLCEWLDCLGEIKIGFTGLEWW